MHLLVLFFPLNLNINYTSFYSLFKVSGPFPHSLQSLWNIVMMVLYQYAISTLGRFL